MEKTNVERPTSNFQHRTGPLPGPPPGYRERGRSVEFIRVDGEVEVEFAAEIRVVRAEGFGEVGGHEPFDGAKVEALGLGGGEEAAGDQGVDLVGEVVVGAGAGEVEVLEDGVGGGADVGGGELVFLEEGAGGGEGRREGRRMKDEG